MEKFLKNGGVRQFGKFAVTGALNTGIDFAVLNILLFSFGLPGAALYSVFKTISFLAAATNSYFWNKFWVFNSESEVAAGEAAAFLLVSIFGLILNTLVASASFVLLRPVWETASGTLLANLSAVLGTLAVMLSNFIGYRRIVFRYEHFQ